MGQWLECIREQLKLKPVTGQADTLWEIFWLWMTFTNVRGAKNQSYLLKGSHKVTCIRIRNNDFVIVIIIIIIIMMIGSREFLEFLRNSSILIIIAIVFSIISLIISRGSWFGETRWSGWHVSGAQPDICASSACYGDGDDDCDLLGNWLTENTNPWLWFLFVCPSPTSQVPQLTLQKRVGEPDDVMLMMEIIIQDQPSEWDWESQESWRSAPGIQSKRWIFSWIQDGEKDLWINPSGIVVAVLVALTLHSLPAIQPNILDLHQPGVLEQFWHDIVALCHVLNHLNCVGLGSNKWNRNETNENSKLSKTKPSSA